MDHNLAEVIAIALVCGTLLSGFAIFMFARRKPASHAQENDQMSARLARIEQAVDTIAIEVERISEGQRFTSKLLADREGAAVPRVPNKAVTPH